MYFVETQESDMVNGMTNGYWVQAWTAWASFLLRYPICELKYLVIGCSKADGTGGEEMWKDSIRIFYFGIYVLPRLFVVLSCQTRSAW